MARRSLLAITLICLASAAAMAEQRSAQEFRYEYDEYNRILLPIEFADGQVSGYLFDTAARFFGVTNAEQARRRMLVYDSASIHVFTSRGNLRLPVATFTGAQFGQAELGKRYVAVFPDGAQIQGYVGNRFFRNYLVHIQPTSKKIELHPNSSDFSSGRWSIISGRRNKFGAILIDAESSGEPLDVLLATGNSRTLIDWHAARRLFPGLETGLMPKTFEVTTGIDDQPMQLASVQLPPVDLGGWFLEGVEVGVAHLPVRDATGYMNSNLLVLGADILSQQEMVIDFRYSQLWLPMNLPR